MRLRWLVGVENLLKFTLGVAIISWLLRRLEGHVQGRPPAAGVAINTATGRKWVEHIDAAAILDVVLRNASHGELQALFDRLPWERHEALANAVHSSGAIRASALFIAASNRSAPLARVLLDAGADATAGRLDEGTTPLHVAAGWLHSEAVVDALLAAPERAGVARSARSKPALGGLRGKTPVYWAMSYGHWETRKKLLAFMSDAGWKYNVAGDTFAEAINPDPSEAKEAAAREAARERGQQAYERAEAHHRARDTETREALATWNAIDVNADGVVAGDEMDSLGTLLTTVGEPLSDDELEAFIADVDKNGDGEIGRREFMVWMRESVSDPEDD